MRGRAHYPWFVVRYNNHWENWVATLTAEIAVQREQNLPPEPPPISVILGLDPRTHG
ncbi:hypothetical protein FHW17_001908 [Phyllobacterium sp. P30BS-XVII]|nr:hypothetical protein [Phyllobacterium sp. P30BS-XVII]